MRSAAARKVEPDPIPTTEELELQQPPVKEDDIRQRAYVIYLERGATPGDEVQDWLQAERELRGGTHP